jgi:hypothetical protein
MAIASTEPGRDQLAPFVVDWSILRRHGRVRGIVVQLKLNAHPARVMSDWLRITFHQIHDSPSWIPSTPHYRIGPFCHCEIVCSRRRSDPIAHSQTADHELIAATMGLSQRLHFESSPIRASTRRVDFLAIDSTCSHWRRRIAAGGAQPLILITLSPALRAAAGQPGLTSSVDDADWPGSAVGLILAAAADR